MNEPTRPGRQGAAESPVATALASLKRLPDLRASIEAVALFLCVMLAGALAMRLGIIELNPATGRQTLILIWLSLFIIPSLGEELVFRSWLKPGSPVAAMLSLAAFIAWHPLQVALNLPYANRIFVDPRFLALAGVLGLACTVSRVRSGSIWPAVVIHWGAATVWKALFAGG